MSKSSQAKTPFDSIVPTNCGKPLRLIIASDSIFLRQNDVHTVTNLCACAQFKEVSLIFTPSNDSTVLQQLEKQSPNFVTFKDSSNGFVFHADNTHYFYRNKVDLGGSGNLNEKILNSQISYGERVINHLINDGKIGDYYVIDKEDFSCLSDQSKLLTPHEALEVIRLFMLKLERFYIRDNFTTDETGYYWYRVQTQFKSFNRIWSDSVGNRDLEKWLSSLLDRLEFFCRSIDSIKLEILRQPNHITSSRILYHLNYISASIPGIFDNIAHFINQRFDLKITDMLKIVLKKKDKDLSSNCDSCFISALRPKCENLAQYISLDTTQRKIQVIYPFRDGFVHREQLAPALYVDSSSNVRMNSFFVSDVFFEKLAALNESSYDYKSCFLVSNAKIKLIHPANLISLLEVIVNEVVNTLLDLIPTSKENLTWKNPEEDFDGLMPIYF